MTVIQESYDDGNGMYYSNFPLSDSSLPKKPISRKVALSGTHKEKHMPTPEQTTRVTVHMLRLNDTLSLQSKLDTQYGIKSLISPLQNSYSLIFEYDDSETRTRDMFSKIINMNGANAPKSVAYMKIS